MLPILCIPHSNAASEKSILVRIYFRSNMCVKTFEGISILKQKKAPCYEINKLMPLANLAM